jgi:type I restriction enzyme S subunit
LRDNVIRASLGELARRSTLSFGDGYRTRHDELGRPGYPILRVAQIANGSIRPDESVDHVRHEFSPAIGPKLSRAEDVVLTTKGTFGRRAYLRARDAGYVYSPQVCFFRVAAGDQLIPRYLYYWLGSDDFERQAHGMKSQTDMADYLSLRDLSRITIPLPPVATQRLIAETMGALDDKIDLNRRMSETLESMARALFASWFGESSQRVLGQSVADNAQRGSLEGVLADYSTLNPESWTKGSRPPVIRYVDLAGVKWGRMDTPTRHTGDAPSRAQRVLRPGDTIVGTVRPGNGSYALVSDDGLTGSTGFAVFRPNRPENRAFVYLAATSPANIDALAHLADGAAYPAVRPEVVAMTPVIRVPDPVLTEFAAIANPLLDRFAQSERESRTLAALRDTLLPRLISGELRVPDAECIAVGAGAYPERWIQRGGVATAADSASTSCDEAIDRDRAASSKIPLPHVSKSLKAQQSKR